MQTCPMCGEWVASGAAECPYCGESFGGVQRVDDPGLAKVRTGIALVYFGLVVILLTVIGGLVLVVALRGDPRVIQVIAVAAIVAAVMAFIGKLLCLAVPPAVGATGIIYTSVAIDVATVVLRVASFFIKLPPGLSAVVGVAGIVSYVLFVIFLKRLANYVGRPDLAKLAERVLTMGALGVVLYLGGFLAAGMGPEFWRTGGLLVLFGAILLLVAFVRYARVLHGLKAAI